MLPCSKCGDKKPETDFSPEKRTRRGRKNWCKQCMNQYTRGRAKKNPPDPTLRRAQYLKKMYGVSAVWVDSQVCAICGSDKNKHVDHDHSCCPGAQSCGECVRAVLCANCNHGLGSFMDNPSLLKKAITYLEEHNAS